MLPFPSRSIPAMGIPTKVKNREEAQNLQNPIPVSEASVKKGRWLFRIYCAACHGLTGKRDTPVADKIGAIMPAYGVPNADPMKGGANDLSVEERWHVVNYVRNGLVNEAK